MSDFFSKLEAAAKRTVNSVSNEVSIAAEEQKLRESYQILGKLYYQAKAAGQEPGGADLEDCCRKIQASLDRINDLKQANNVTG